jgi:crotonobetainyl-CoA:carnitine CoA-transferase CaiB-like acyl-CoA transferase
MLVLFGATALGLTPLWPLIGGGLLLTMAALAVLFNGEQTGFPLRCVAALASGMIALEVLGRPMVAVLHACSASSNLTVALCACTYSVAVGALIGAWLGARVNALMLGPGPDRV